MNYDDRPVCLETAQRLRKSDGSPDSRDESDIYMPQQKYVIYTHYRALTQANQPYDF
jgi:hypothetical protein